MMYLKKKLFSFHIGSYSFTLSKNKKDKGEFPPNDYLLIRPKEEYERFFEFVHQWLLERTKKTERLHLLQFLLDVVKRDIQVDLLSEVYYRDEGNITDITRKCFIPLKYVDSHGEVQELESVGKRKVDLEEVVTIVIPWKRARMRDAILHIFDEGFKYDKSNHSPTIYFTEIDLCYAKSGNHHIASGIIQKSGYIEADVYHLEELFHHVYTDGEYWINTHTNERLKWTIGEEERVFDFRIAILFELAKMKYMIENDSM